MKNRARVSSDNWVKDGRNILSSDNLDNIRAELNDSPIIVERWFYRGGSSPDYHVFDDFDEFVAFLNAETCAGDSVYVWSVRKVCTDATAIAKGKCPDDDGMVPVGGAY